MAKVIAITSGKGGVGKTTFCVNLGYALSKLNLKVLLIDGDIGLNNLDVVLGVENKIVYDIVDVIECKCRPRQALIEDFNNSNIFVLPSNHTYSSFEIQSFHLKRVIDELKDEFDYILIDCPAGIEDNFRRIAEVVNESIIVTTPHISSVRDADKTISALKSCFVDDIKFVVNKVRGDLIVSGDMIKVETIVEYLNIPIVGVIPESDDIACQLLVGGACTKGSDVYKIYKMIASNLENGTSEIFDCTKKYRGLFGEIRRNLKRIV